jgi:hypothetical protein
MINLYFFGCSLTAGDELSDDIFFPWQETCKSGEEYYQRRNKFLLDDDLSTRYEESNLALAYPALINNDVYKTYSYAKNGASLRENIYRILKLIYENNDIGAIFLQLPPPGREMHIVGIDFVTTLRFSDAKITITDKEDAVGQYINAKLMSHSNRQYSLEDLMDLLMLNSLARQKNIKLCIINITNQLPLRLEDIQGSSEFQFINDNLLKEINLINLPQHLRVEQTLGGHLNKFAHRGFAEIIKAMLPNILNLQA